MCEGIHCLDGLIGITFGLRLWLYVCGVSPLQANAWANTYDGRHFFEGSAAHIRWGCPMGKHVCMQDCFNWVLSSGPPLLHGFMYGVCRGAIRVQVQIDLGN